MCYQSFFFFFHLAWITEIFIGWVCHNIIVQTSLSIDTFSTPFFAKYWIGNMIWNSFAGIDTNLKIFQRLSFQHHIVNQYEKIILFFLFFMFENNIPNSIYFFCSYDFIFSIFLQFYREFVYLFYFPICIVGEVNYFVLIWCYNEILQSQSSKFHSDDHLFLPQKCGNF